MISSRISFSTWNINGLSNKTLGDKLQNNDFLSSINNCDFLILTEIWNRSQIEIPGYKNFTTLSNKTNCSGRQSGGITFLFKNKFQNEVTMVQNSRNIIWCKLSKEVWGYTKDVYICGLYIPPHNSPHFNSDIFDRLENDISKYLTEGFVLLLGDFNARTGKYADTVSKDGNDYIENDRSEVSLRPPNRNSFDNVINSHGKRLLQICKHFDLKILNGRTNGDSLGRPTFHGRNGISVVDYIICDQNIFADIDHFIVKQPSYLSDHSQIVGWFKSKLGTLQLTSDKETSWFKSLTKLPPQFIWEKDSNVKFSSSLNLPNIQSLIIRFLEEDFIESEEGITKAVNQVQEIIRKAASTSLKLKQTRRRTKIRNTINKKWFDKDCKMKRIRLRKLSNQKHKDPANISIRESYHVFLKEYKQLLTFKKQAFHDEKVKQLRELSNSSDSRSFWKTLKSMNDDIIEKTIPPISEDQWLHHFESLHSEKRNNEDQTNLVNNLKFMEQNCDQIPSYEPITEKEIIENMKKLKNKKAAFSDKTKNEMIKASSNALLNVYKKLFNLILKSGIFPIDWCEGLITPIFKNGDKKDTNNYRGICVSSCLGKFFCTILNQRLLALVETKKLLHHSQIGFLPGHRTADHVLTIKTLIEKHVYHRNEPIYACFVDFKKAFDSVWHQGLLYKLLSYGINDNIYKLIKNLYSKSSCAIKLDNSKTRSFKYSRGVRQGCILSPLLFNIYLNELPFSLNTTKSADPLILPNGTKLNSLLYADDLIILSRSKQGLQNCLNTLESFCTTSKLDVNLKKTKIMIFQKKTRKSQNPQFYFNNRLVEITQEYTYLGVKLTPSGNFNTAKEQLRDKGMHALFGIHKYTNINKLPSQLASKIFDTMISPILMYNSEVWGAYLKSEFDHWDKSPIEKVHLRFCKLYLNVNKKATNIACRAELGRFPLKIAIDQKILNYILHLKAQPENSIVHQAFKLSRQLHSKDRNSFYTNVTNLLKSQNMTIDSISTKHNVNSYITKTKETYIDLWKNKIKNSTKLEFYKIFKTNYNCEQYLNVINDPIQRRNYTKFRISNHNLMIESGRYGHTKIPKENRRCQVCNSDHIENERHLIFSCTCYNELRERLFDAIKNSMKIEFDPKDCQTQFITVVMQSTNPQVIRIFSKFVSDCFYLRECNL